MKIGCHCGAVIVDQIDGFPCPWSSNALGGIGRFGPRAFDGRVFGLGLYGAWRIIRLSNER